jgi:hypothetical protein
MPRQELVQELRGAQREAITQLLSIRNALDITSDNAEP